jgi:hypothetical protein
LIDELVREGARRMLAEALQAEIDDYTARHLGERDEHGRRLVKRNGQLLAPAEQRDEPAQTFYVGHQAPDEASGLGLAPDSVRCDVA